MKYFFLIGAQKSGTTSLAHTLSQHSDICFSTPKEPMFFSHDDALIHPHLFVQRQAEWLNSDSLWQADAKQDVLELYRNNFFPHYQGEKYLAEASTSYLPSHYANKRIAGLLPDAKIIIVLRNPVDRAYSAYWHYVRTGVATETFWRHLQYENGLTLAMGDYEQSIQLWMNYFSASSIKIVLFEEMISKPQLVLNEIYTFLDLPMDEREIKKLNVGYYPKWLRLYLYINWLSRHKHQQNQKSGVMGLYLKALKKCKRSI